MEHFNDILKQSVQDTMHYLGTLKYRKWFTLLLLGMFTGWNGVQFIIAPNHLFSFFEWDSLVSYLQRLFYDQNFYFPVSFFLLLSFAIICWFIHVYSEVVLLHRLTNKKKSFAEYKAITFNYAIPATGVFVLTVIGLLTAYLLLFILYLVLLVLGVNLQIAFANTMFKFFLLTIFLVVFLQYPFIDIVLPLLCTGQRFSRAYTRLKLLCIKSFKDVAFIYSIRVFSILFTIIIYWLLFDFLFLPIVRYIRTLFDMYPKFLFSEMFGLREALLNISSIITVVLLSLAFFSPVIIIYIFQKYFLFRYLQRLNVPSLASIIVKPIDEHPIDEEGEVDGKNEQ